MTDYLERIRDRFQKRCLFNTTGWVFRGSITLLFCLLALISKMKLSLAEGEGPLQEGATTEPKKSIESEQIPPDMVVINFLTQNKNLLITKFIAIENRILEDPQWRYICKVELLDGEKALIHFALNVNSLMPMYLSLEGYEDRSQLEPRLHEEKNIY